MPTYAGVPGGGPAKAAKATADVVCAKCTKAGRPEKAYCLHDAKDCHFNPQSSATTKQLKDLFGKLSSLQKSFEQSENNRSRRNNRRRSRSRSRPRLVRNTGRNRENGKNQHKVNAIEEIAERSRLVLVRDPILAATIATRDPGAVARVLVVSTDAAVLGSAATARVSGCCYKQTTQ